MMWVAAEAMIVVSGISGVLCGGGSVAACPLHVVKSFAKSRELPKSCGEGQRSSSEFSEQYVGIQREID